MLIDLKKVDDLPDDQVVLMCTGSQGEPMAALSRIANSDHKVSVGPGDTVVLASSLIPGNENAVFRVINGLTRLGASVVHQGNAKVHVSGHASAGELLTATTSSARATSCRCTARSGTSSPTAALAVQTGVPPSASCWPRTASSSTSSTARRGSSAPCRAGTSTSTAPRSARSPRPSSRTAGSCGDEGFISIFAVVDSQTGKVVAGPQMHARGVAEDEARLAEIVPEIEKALAQATADGNYDSHELQQAIRRTVGRWASTRLRRRPMIIPVVVLA